MYIKKLFSDVLLARDQARSIKHNVCKCCSLIFFFSLLTKKQNKKKLHFVYHILNNVINKLNNCSIVRIDKKLKETFNSIVKKREKRQTI